MSLQPMQFSKFVELIGPMIYQWFFNTSLIDEKFGWKYEVRTKLDTKFQVGIRNGFEFIWILFSNVLPISGSERMLREFYMTRIVISRKNLWVEKFPFPV